MKMGTRVSQYVHFIIYQTASETRGGGRERLGGACVEGDAEAETQQNEKKRGEVKMLGNVLGGGMERVGVKRLTGLLREVASCWKGLS